MCIYVLKNMYCVCMSAPRLVKRRWGHKENCMRGATMLLIHTQSLSCMKRGTVTGRLEYSGLNSGYLDVLGAEVP